MTKKKLTASEVIDIRRDFLLGSTTANIADHYDVTQRTVQRIISGSIWSSIPEDRGLPHGNGNYEVTYDGRIWSSVKGDYLDTDHNGNVRLSINGKKKTLNVDSLVKELF